MDGKQGQNESTKGPRGKTHQTLGPDWPHSCCTLQITHCGALFHLQPPGCWVAASLVAGPLNAQLIFLIRLDVYDLLNFKFRHVFVGYFCIFRGLFCLKGVEHISLHVAVQGFVMVCEAPLLYRTCGYFF